MTFKSIRNILIALALVMAETAYCRAQVIVIDDVILLSRSENTNQQRRTRGHLTPVGTESPLPPAPGADEPLLGGPTRVGPRLSTLPRPRRGERPVEDQGQRIIELPRSTPVPSLSSTAPLELPSEEDDGPPEGLPLDLAIERLVNTNYDLRIRYQEIPTAQADILSAGLRNNPFLFVSADAIPYGRFSPQRPGATLYDITLIQPIDISGKRRNRILVAQQAKRVLEAQYQNSVRREIDRLYTGYVDVLAARESLRASRAAVARWDQLGQETEKLVRQKQRPEIELSRARLQKFHAENSQRAAEVVLVQAKRNLATLLALPAEQADALEIRASLHDRAPPPPCAEVLLELASRVRPDLAAYRMGVERARADVQLARSEGLEDVFLFYTPLTTMDFSPLGKQSASGWGLGLLLPIPVFNRNQGNVERARINVTQIQIELEGLERQVADEVRRAYSDYEASGLSVRRFEREGLPAIHLLREEKLQQYSQGKESLESVLQIQKEYGDMVRRYMDSLVRHRRNMLALNTAVGQRLLP